MAGQRNNQVLRFGVADKHIRRDRPLGWVSPLLLSAYQRPGKDLIQGMKRGEFHIEYQPLVTSHDGQQAA
jgi:hypothetical protein